LQALDQMPLCVLRLKWVFACCCGSLHARNCKSEIPARPCTCIQPSFWRRWLPWMSGSSLAHQPQLHVSRMCMCHLHCWKRTTMQVVLIAHGLHATCFLVLLCTQAFADNKEAQALAAGSSPSSPPAPSPPSPSRALRTATASVASAAACCAATLLAMAWWATGHKQASRLLWHGAELAAVVWHHPCLRRVCCPHSTPRAQHHPENASAKREIAGPVLNFHLFIVHANRHDCPAPATHEFQPCKIRCTSPMGGYLLRLQTFALTPPCDMILRPAPEAAVLLTFPPSFTRWTRGHSLIPCARGRCAGPTVDAIARLSLCSYCSRLLHCQKQGRSWAHKRSRAPLRSTFSDSVDRTGLRREDSEAVCHAHLSAVCILCAGRLVAVDWVHVTVLARRSPILLMLRVGHQAPTGICWVLCCSLL